MISVLVYTKNEERNISDCLATVSWSDDIHVVDSHSDDHTPAIARALGARVTSRSYTDESEQKNWAMSTLPFRHDWVFQIDADERCTPGLAEEMGAAVASPKAYVAFRFPRRDYFLGKWIRHVQLQRYSLRLVRRDCVHYERRINPVCRIRGAVGQLRGYLDHYPFSKGTGQWIERHNRYSTLEAEELLQVRATAAWTDLWGLVTERDFHTRRCHQKRLFYRLPCRPLIKLLYLYVWRLGFLDGKAGRDYALLQSWYEYLISLKSAEMRENAAQEAGAMAPHCVADDAPRSPV